MPGERSLCDPDPADCGCPRAHDLGRRNLSRISSGNRCGGRCIDRSDLAGRRILSAGSAVEADCGDCTHSLHLDAAADRPSPGWFAHPVWMSASTRLWRAACRAPSRWTSVRHCLAFAGTVDVGHCIDCHGGLLSIGDVQSPSLCPHCRRHIDRRGPDWPESRLSAFRRKPLRSKSADADDRSDWSCPVMCDDAACV